MAGKQDELFFLGAEEIGIDPHSTPEAESAAATVVDPAPSGSPRSRPSRLLILGALLVAVVAAVALGRPGGDAAQPPRPHAGVPVLEDPPQASAMAADSARSRPPSRPLTRHREQPRRRVRSGERTAAKQQPAPAPPAESASAPLANYAPTPTAAPEAAPVPAPEGTAAAPAPATPVTSARPEFGIER